MRAGVGAVQHTLTPAAASVVRAAVAEAKSRGHNQVQPLHVAAILLIQSSPGSPLRRACLQSHNNDLSHPLQCRALELCFKIALDRLPSNQEKSPNPVLSNALVAALKRAQAHQRRGTPEQSLQPLLAVKVEMDQLIISILDDPSVSRVMREAGFSSIEVKSSMEEAAAQQSPSLTCSSSSLDRCSQLRRRERLPMTPYTGSPLESVQFRHSLFSPTSSLMFESPDGNLRGVERGLLSNAAEAQSDKESPLRGPFHRQDSDGHAFPPSPFLEKSPLFLNRMEQSRLHPQAPVSSNSGSLRSAGHEEDVRNVVEALKKKRNPVLVNDVGLSSNSLIVKEFAQRLKCGDVPAFLKDAQFLSFPFNSLAVGLLSQEEMQQKLSQLRNVLEGSMPGGAILSLGDLQWLAESAQGKATVTHAHACLAIEELTHFLESYSSQRFWLIATASSQTLMGCQAGNPSLVTRLNLQPILLAANSSLGFQSRYGCHQSKYNGALTSSGQSSSANPLQMKSKFPAVENSLDGLDCCPECTSKYQNELSRLMRQERGTHPGLALQSFNTPPLWMRQTKDANWPPLVAVKEEEDMLSHNPLLSQRIQDLKENWRRICSGHSASPGGLSTFIDSARSHHRSNQGLPGSIQSVDRSSSLMSRMMGLSKLPETVKFLVAKSDELASPVSSKSGSIPPWAISPGAISGNSNRAMATSNSNSIGPSVGFGGWMKRNDTTGPLDSSKLSSAVAHRDTMGADLALGRSSAEVSSLSRDLREEGQQPLIGELKLSIAGNSRKEPEPVPEVSLPWRVSIPAGTECLKASEQKPTPSNFFRPNDMDSLKGLSRGLQEMVPWQREASSSVALTVSDCRAGNGRKRGASIKSDTWLLFLGPDRVGKREVAKALAKLVFGDEKKLIWMQLSGNQVDTASLGTGMGILTSDNNGVRYRGRTPLDRLVEAVRMKPFSVVLLEDVDQADSVVRGNLLRAMERGKLASSSGKEVSFANVIVIMTCSVGGSLLSPRQNFEREGTLGFEEEKLSRLSSYGMKFRVDDAKCEKIVHDNGRGVAVVNYSLALEGPSLEGTPSPSLSCKRRGHWALQTDVSDCLPVEKRLKKEGSVVNKALALDLNLSAEENESVDEVSCTTDVNTPDRPAEQETEQALAKKVIACARESLPKDIFDLVDASVMFEPFDFATLTDGVLEQLGSASRSVLNTGATMEIDVAVLEQLVSAAWQTSCDHKVFNSWVNDVLVNNLSTITDKCEVRPSSVVKLMVDRGQALESAAVRVGLLPVSIKFV